MSVYAQEVPHVTPSSLVSSPSKNIKQEPTTQEKPNPPDMELMLEVVINGKETNQIVPISFHSGHYYILSSIFNTFDLPLKINDRPTVELDTLTDLKVSYDSAGQRLLVDAPLDWMPEQYIPAQRKSSLEFAGTTTGLLLNYDIYSSKTSGSKNSQLSVYTEQRLFGNFGFLSNNGIYTQSLESSNANNATKDQYIRYDTSWYYNDEKRMLQYALGDLTTDALSWSGSVRLGGVRFGRNFTTNPDLITYPLPQFAGQAAIPSSVDLFINNFKQSSSNVHSGPFTIETVPFINGAGNAIVVVTDALGRRVSASVPFYVSSDLLKAGLSDFSVSLGAIRQKYAIDSFEYGDLAASGVARYGLTNYVTIEGRAEGAKNLSVGGLGSNIMLGSFGVLSGSYSGSATNADAFYSDDALPSQKRFTNKKGHITGEQTSIGYSYTNSFFSINAKRIIRSEDYGDLSSYKSNYRLDRRVDQLTGSLSIKNQGSLGVGYFDVRHAQHDRTRLLNLSYSRPLWKNVNFFLSANREIGGDGYNAQIIFSIPLGNNQMASLSSSKDENNKWDNRVGYNRTAPTEGGLGWNIAYGDGNREGSSYKQANLDWQSQKYRMQGGVYGNSDETYWAEFSGSIIAMDGGIYAAKQINDAFSLVSTDGQSGIPVRYENSLVGNTDKNGYLLIPSISSYVRGLYEIDPLNLSANIKTPEVQQRRAVKQGGGLLVKFPIKKIHAANLSLVDEQGHELPQNSVVTMKDSDYIGYTGWDGLVYIEGVGKENNITIKRSDNNQKCYAKFNLANTDGIQSIQEPIICKSERHEN